MRAIAALVIPVFLSGCASYLTARPPIMEDKLGLWGRESVGTLSTAADYRVVYVRLSEDVKLCAEPPADAGAQFGQTFAAAFQGPLGGARELSAEAKAGLAVAMKQLFKRSQGVQLFRDGGFMLCNLYLNGGISAADYLNELKALRTAATGLIKEEIPYLDKVTIDPIAVPSPATPPSVNTSRKGQTEGSEAPPPNSQDTSNSASDKSK